MENKENSAKARSSGDEGVTIFLGKFIVLFLSRHPSNFYLVLQKIM